MIIIRIDEIARQRGLTPADLGRIGGKSRNNRYSFRITKKRNCNRRCPIYERCLFQPLSVNYNGKCALANAEMTDKTRKEYTSIITGKGNERYELMKNILAELLIDTKKDRTMEAKRKFLRDIKLVDETILGKKMRQEINQKTEMTIKDYVELIKSVRDNENREDESQ